MLKRHMPEGRKLRVCVVGAGVAGLRASYTLMERGVDVTIYEARDRVGGRVAQSNHLGYLVDLGANWIHGAGDNPILDLARRTGTVIHAWDEHQAVFDEDGSRVPDKDVYATLEEFWDIILEAREHSNANWTSIAASESLMDFVTRKADSIFALEAKVDQAQAERKRRLLLREADIWSAYVGGSIRQQSLKFFWLEECLEGETPFVAETFKKILDAIITPALEKGNLELNHAVTGVHMDKQGKEAGGVIVETSKGTREAFDEVIVTCPLGWLKRNTGVFYPPLPARLVQAIDSVGYGSLDKVYITFPSAFWNRPEAAMSSASKPGGANGISCTSDKRNTNNFPNFVNWYRPSEYAADVNPQGWDQQAVNLAALPGSTAHPTLLFYIYGDCARYVADLASRMERQPGASGAKPGEGTAAAKTNLQAQDDLIAFFEPYFSRLPNYSSSSPECIPSAVLATAWANDEFAGYGSYCNFQVGIEDAARDVEVMRTGAPERGLWLAGEHTAPVEGLGTVTGAWWAGESVAKRILDLYIDLWG